jgi:hypothetical protein
MVSFGVDHLSSLFAYSLSLSSSYLLTPLFVLPTMKTILSLVLVAYAAAFAPQQQRLKSSSALDMGMFDNMFSKKKAAAPTAVPQAKNSSRKKKNWVDNMFTEPIHGHGSDEDKIKEMYEEQQAMLHNRQSLFGSDQMKKKYKGTKKDHLSEIETIDFDPKNLNKKEDDAMYVDENTPTFDFPWGKLKP